MSLTPFIQLPFAVPGVSSYLDVQKIAPMFPSDLEAQADGQWCFGSDNPDQLDLLSGLALNRNLRGVVEAGGSGYTTLPTVVLTGGGGTGMTAKCRVVSGAVEQVWVDNFGTGYTSAPSISFTGGGGSGAAASFVRTAAPILSANYLTIAAGDTKQALATPFDDTNNQTLCAVIQRGSTAGVRLGIWCEGYANSNALYGDTVFGGFTRAVRGISTSVSVPAPAGSSTDWLFVGMSASPTGWVHTWGGGATESRTGTKTVEAGHKLLLGTEANPANFGVLNAAELIHFPYGMSGPEMQAVYARSKARMAKRGLTVL